MRSLAILLFSLVVGGCTSAGGSTFRRGDLVLPAYAGNISIYASSNPPEDALDLGLVEVHAIEDEATVDALMPLFLEKVASLGGEVAVIDAVRARFERNPRIEIETYYTTCGSGMPCAAKHAYATADEVMTVTIIGRAMTRKHGAISPRSDAPRPNLLPAAPMSTSVAPLPPAHDGASEPAKPEEISP